MKVAEILKDWPSWFRDCRAVDVLNVLSTGNGGTIELLYMQVSHSTTNNGLFVSILTLLENIKLKGTFVDLI